mgnify:CR=1 FL=1
MEGGERERKGAKGSDMETECTAEKASPLCGFVALLLTLGTTSLMNGSLFPQFDAIFMFARDISVTFSAATLLGLGLAAYRAPRLLRERAIVAVAVACLVGGGALRASPPSADRWPRCRRRFISRASKCTRRP